MKFLPFENILYKSKLSSEEILKRLGEVIEPKKTFRMKGLLGSGNHKPYEGYINGYTFNINRLIGYSNSFLPRIKGTIEKDYNGTRIEVKMRLHPFVTVFMLIWFGGIGMVCLTFLAAMSDSDSSDQMTLIPFGMLIFGYALVTGGFKYVSIKSKKYLAKLFDAEIEK